MKWTSLFNVLIHKQEYIGSIGRFDVTRHWFKDDVYARYVQFRPTEVNGGSTACMRIQVLGCATGMFNYKDFVYELFKLVSTRDSWIH